eukprot:g25188.t1
MNTDLYSIPVREIDIKNSDILQCGLDNLGVSGRHFETIEGNFGTSGDLQSLGQVFWGSFWGTQKFRLVSVGQFEKRVLRKAFVFNMARPLVESVQTIRSDFNGEGYLTINGLPDVVRVADVDLPEKVRSKYWDWPVSWNELAPNVIYSYNATTKRRSAAGLWENAPVPAQGGRLQRRRPAPPAPAPPPPPPPAPLTCCVPDGKVAVKESAPPPAKKAKVDKPKKHAKKAKAPDPNKTKQPIKQHDKAKALTQPLLSRVQNGPLARPNTNFNALEASKESLTGPQIASNVPYQRWHSRALREFNPLLITTGQDASGLNLVNTNAQLFMNVKVSKYYNNIRFSYPNYCSQAPVERLPVNTAGECDDIYYTQIKYTEVCNFKVSDYVNDPDNKLMFSGYMTIMANRGVNFLTKYVVQNYTTVRGFFVLLPKTINVTNFIRVEKAYSCEVDADCSSCGTCVYNATSNSKKCVCDTCCSGVTCELYDQVDYDGDQVGDCADLCDHDRNKTDPGQCGCNQADLDRDGDNVADCVDLCPDDPNKIAEGHCGCSVAETPDSDGDNVYDCDDKCGDDASKHNSTGICGCDVSDVDSDLDGVADCNEDCDGDPFKSEPGVCGCGIPDDDLDGDNTIDCFDNCTGSPKVDPGICGCAYPDNNADNDALHDCPQISASGLSCLLTGYPLCVDLCPNDQNKVVPGVCGCGLADTDSDGDGTPDCIDQCDLDSNKTLPGVCGCGVSEVDTDGDGSKDCQDECDLNPLKTLPLACGCDQPDQDQDGDNTVDCLDLCPDSAIKFNPGLCGCYLLDTDTDGDNVPDCDDVCDHDRYKAQDSNSNAPLYKGLCPCGVSEADTDGDGVLDCFDGCELDPAKTSRGVCGCGILDVDSDGDYILDCNEECPLDPFKYNRGVCDCGVNDSDTDQDGTADCVDGCPYHFSKIQAGQCGCPNADTDSDLDGVADCNDACDLDANKWVSEGDCGCGKAENDTDRDGVKDCSDECDFDENKILPGICGCGQNDTNLDNDTKYDCPAVFISADGRSCLLTGYPNCTDLCPTNPNKIHPGDCGCNAPDVDSDGDQLVDCLDACPQDYTKTYLTGICPCGVPDIDSDGDFVLNCLEACPFDPNKTSQGLCGCGQADPQVDMNGDSVLNRSDCTDLCPGDAEKFAPGICGCNISDVDTDHDGYADCLDVCPTDPAKWDNAGPCGCDSIKQEPGICGCNVSDIDSDSDGVANCLDQCPYDPDKVYPQVCGCHAEDIDSDGDSTVDCMDECPFDNSRVSAGECGCFIDHCSPPLIRGPYNMTIYTCGAEVCTDDNEYGNSQFKAGWTYPYFRVEGVAPALVDGKFYTLVTTPIRRAIQEEKMELPRQLSTQQIFTQDKEEGDQFAVLVQHTPRRRMTNQTDPPPCPIPEGSNCCQILNIGPSASGVKTVTFDGGFSCPTYVDKNKWEGGYADTFGFTLTQTQTTATVSKSTAGGWDIDLRVKCCATKVNASSWQSANMTEGATGWSNRVYSYVNVPYEMAGGTLRKGPYDLSRGSDIQFVTPATETRVYVLLTSETWRDGGYGAQLAADTDWKPVGAPSYVTNLANPLLAFVRCYPANSVFKFPSPTKTDTTILGVVVQSGCTTFVNAFGWETATMGENVKAWTNASYPYVNVPTSMLGGRLQRGPFELTKGTRVTASGGALRTAVKVFLFIEAGCDFRNGGFGVSIGQDPLWFPTTAPKWKTPDGFLHLLLGYTRCYSAGETFALPATTTERTLMGLVFVDGASCAATIYRPGWTVVDMLDGQLAWTDRSFSYQGVPLGMSMGRLQQGPHLLPSGTVLRADITGNATRVFVFFSADATKDGGLYNSLVIDPAWSGELQNKPQWHDGSTLHNMRGFSRCYPSRSQLVLPATTTAQGIVGVVMKDVTDGSCDRMCPAGYAYVPGAAFSPQFLDGMTKETQAECAEWCTSYGSLCQATFWTPSSLDCTLSMSVLLPQPDPSVIKSPFEFIPCAKANLVTPSPSPSRSPSPSPSPAIASTDYLWILWKKVADTTNYNASWAECAEDDLMLCSRSQLCQGARGSGLIEGIPQLAGEEWTPVSDAANEWVQVGDVAGDTCELYSEKIFRLNGLNGMSCNEAIHAAGSTYRGCQSKTVSGKTCKPWTSAMINLYPDAGLYGHNYCRNPDGKSTIWCYTTDVATPWEICNPIALAPPWSSSSASVPIRGQVACCTEPYQSGDVPVVIPVQMRAPPLHISATCGTPPECYGDEVARLTDGGPTTHYPLTDFTTLENPNGMWSYGLLDLTAIPSGSTTQPIKLSKSAYRSFIYLLEAEGYTSPGIDLKTAVGYKGICDSTQTIGVIMEGQTTSLLMHGGNCPNRAAVLRWTAPSYGTSVFRGSFSTSGSATLMGIRHHNVYKYQVTGTSAGPFLVSFYVDRGEAVDIVVIGGSASLTLTIEQAEPAGCLSCFTVAVVNCSGTPEQILDRVQGPSWRGFPATGVTEFSCVGTDFYGNFAVADFESTLVDNEPPVIVFCPPDERVRVGTVYSWNITATDDFSATHEINFTTNKGQSGTLVAGSPGLPCCEIPTLFTFQAYDRYLNTRCPWPSCCEFIITVYDEYEWYVTEWGPCDTACGAGKQTRTAVCKNSLGVTVSDHFCLDQNLTSPVLEQGCFIPCVPDVEFSAILSRVQILVDSSGPEDVFTLLVEFITGVNQPHIIYNNDAGNYSNDPAKGPLTGGDASELTSRRDGCISTYTAGQGLDYCFQTFQYVQPIPCDVNELRLPFAMDTLCSAPGCLPAQNNRFLLMLVLQAENYCQVQLSEVELLGVLTPVLPSYDHQAWLSSRIANPAAPQPEKVELFEPNPQVMAFISIWSTQVILQNLKIKHARSKVYDNANMAGEPMLTTNIVVDFEAQQAVAAACIVVDFEAQQAVAAAWYGYQSPYGITEPANPPPSGQFYVRIEAEVEVYYLLRADRTGQGQLGRRRMMKAVLGEGHAPTLSWLGADSEGLVQARRELQQTQQGDGEALIAGTNTYGAFGYIKALPPMQVSGVRTRMTSYQNLPTPLFGFAIFVLIIGACCCCCCVVYGLFVLNARKRKGERDDESDNSEKGRVASVVNIYATPTTSIKELGPGEIWVNGSPLVRPDSRRALSGEQHMQSDGHCQSTP